MTLQAIVLSRDLAVFTAAVVVLIVVVLGIVRIAEWIDQ